MLLLNTKDSLKQSQVSRTDLNFKNSTQIYKKIVWFRLSFVVSITIMSLMKVAQFYRKLQNGAKLLNIAKFVEFIHLRFNFNTSCSF